MRFRLLTPALTLTLLGTASAADYSRVVWSYATGQSKVKPMMDSRMMDQLVMQVWTQPPGVPAEGLMFMYMPKLSQAHWALMVLNPAVPARDLFGAQSTRFVGSQKDPKRPELTWKVYRLADGTFKNLTYLDGTGTDKAGRQIRVIMLITPQFMGDKLSPADLLK